MILRTRTICIDSLVSVNVSGMQFCMPLFLISFLTLCFLLRLLIIRPRILRHSIPVDLIPTHRICLSPAEVAAVAFYGVNISAIAAFYDAHVVPAAVAVPGKEDNVSGSRFVLSASGNAKSSLRGSVSLPEFRFSIMSVRSPRTGGYFSTVFSMTCPKSSLRS